MCLQPTSLTMNKDSFAYYDIWAFHCCLRSTISFRKLNIYEFAHLSYIRGYIVAVRIQRYPPLMTNCCCWQTRLHDTVCNKRQLATIATHDLALLPPGPLHYMARPPAKLKLVPLGQDQEVTAIELVQQLQQEAQENSGHSGVHR
jgi:hypothetical protein